MKTALRTSVLVTAVALTGAGVTATADATPAQHPAPHPDAKHVLLISVDGLHQSDLAWYVRTHPGSALAGLVHHGVDYTSARTPFPSDSFPGLIAQVTGGNPKTTGIYYDVTYNHDLLAPGTTNCAGAAKGTTVAYDESIDRDSSRLDAGQGLPALPGDIDKMTSTPQTLLDQAKLPVDPRTCEPVYPNQYVKVNNVFEVARSHDLRTAWSDKHPAYTILDGPSGTGVQDMFTPEINSTADAAGDDWTTVNSLTKQYDSYKVTAVRNEIDGYDHSRTRHVGVPAIFGLNFQTVSTAQKLPTSGGKTGGYQADGVTPGPLLSGALDYVDQQVGGLVGELRAQHLDHSTTVILSAKHGQSPQDPASLTRIDDGAVLDGLNGAWRAAGHSGDLVAGSSDDDAMLLWLTDRSPAATGFAKSYLASYSGNGSGTDGHAKATDINGKPKSYTSAGLTTIYAGADAARFIGVPPTDGRVPDLIGIANHGTVFTGGTKKIAEHGGDDPSDRDVALVVSGPSIKHARWTAPVETTQIAPTILASLGISPAELRAVRGEGTPVLPGTRR